MNEHLIKLENCDNDFNSVSISEGTFCDAKGSERCDEKTGICICKTKQTTGDKCDICPTGFYMHSLGCTTCDHCPNDNFRSNGTCRPGQFRLVLRGGALVESMPFVRGVVCWNPALAAT